jgi:hypothetical protein
VSCAGSDETDTVVVDVRFHDLEVGCWCSVEMERPARWWGAYATQNDCTDQVYWTWTTDDDRCVGVTANCGMSPSSDPWLGSCEQLVGCCDVAFDHDWNDCESLGWACDEHGRPQPTP